MNTYQQGYMSQDMTFDGTQYQQMQSGRASMLIRVYLDEQDADVKLILNGRPTSSRGTYREYEAWGNHGYVYPHTLTIGSKTYTIRLQPGQKANVNFRSGN